MFVDNGARMSGMRDFLQKLHDDPMIKVSEVKFKGTASPDGSHEFNLWLCENRLRTFTELVNSYTYVPDSIIKSSDSSITWDDFRMKVAESNMAHRNEVLAIIDEEPRLVPLWNNRHMDARLLKLKKLYNGSVWEELKSPILRDLRYGDAVFYWYRMQPVLQAPAVMFADSLPIGLPAVPPMSEPDETWMPRLYVKTNAVGLAMLSANVAVEVDVARHWSVGLPIYYSALDYFKSTIKFRNFTIQPEARYWFRRAENDGLFVGAHFGMSYYNFAFDGTYRYQDHRGRTPALGGGLSAGYRMPLSDNNRWRVEFSLGAGIYPLDYDLFDNTPDVKDGMLMDRNRKLYIGLDQVSVTFSYSFDLERYKRTYRRKGGLK